MSISLKSFLPTKALLPTREAAIDNILLPFLNVMAALVVSALVILALGESPMLALSFVIEGAFGYEEAFGYTLYYTTNFIFTGLAVAIAYHAGLFNIGGEGQATFGGLGMTLVVLQFGNLPAIILLPLAILGGAAFGALWGMIPGWLHVKRNSHVVINTIMFNFIASAFISWLLVGPLQRPDGQMPETVDFSANASLPAMHEILAMVGIEFEQSPLNLSFLIALCAAAVLWFILWRTRLGYEMRVVGSNPEAARFAGISLTKITVITMGLSGALAGMLGINELLGEQHRMVANFTMGYGFVGIAVAFVGRGSPIGIIFAALLFGTLYQGGAELAFEMPGFTRDMIIMIQGIVILFAGAMEHLFRPVVKRILLPSTGGANV